MKLKGNRKRAWLFDEPEQIEEYRKWAKKLGFSGAGPYLTMVARWGHYMFTKAFEKAEKAITDELIESFIDDIYEWAKRLKQHKGKT